MDLPLNPPVGRLMQRPPVVVGRDASIAHCATLLHRHHFRHLPVVDEKGALVGIITDFEIVLRGAMADGDWTPHAEADRALQAHHLLREAQVVLRPEEPAGQALRKLLAAFQDAAILTDEALRPLGIFTEHDAVALAAKVLPTDAPPFDGERMIHTVQRADLATAARSLMLRQRVRHLLVMDQGKLYGVMSFRDVAVEDRLDPRTRCGKLIGAGPVHMVTGSVTVAKAARIMARERIGCIPVVDAHTRPLHVVTRTDVMQALADQYEASAQA